MNKKEALIEIEERITKNKRYAFVHNDFNAITLDCVLNWEDLVFIAERVMEVKAINL